MIRLDEILASYDAVFVDGSVKRVRTNFSHILSSERFLGYDLEILQRDNSRLWHFANLLNHPKTYTIRGVTDELKSLSNIVDDKASQLPGSPYNGSDAFPAIVREMERMQDSLHEILTFSEAKEVSIIDFRYDLLVQMIKDIRRVNGLKETARPNASHSANALSSQDPEVTPRDTDERIIATLYWANMYSAGRLCVLTRDKDFVWLIRNTPRLMSSDAFMPHNEDFRKMMESASLDVYTPEKILPYFSRVTAIEGQRENPVLPEHLVDRAEYLKGRLGHLWRGYHQMRPVNTEQLRSNAL